jgi:hypothetical protein
MRRFLTLSIVVLTLAVPYATDAAPVFRFSTIDAGGYETDPFGINSSAQIVGTVYDNFYCDDYGVTPPLPTVSYGTLVRSRASMFRAPSAPTPSGSTTPARLSEASRMPPAPTAFSRTCSA